MAPCAIFRKSESRCVLFDVATEWLAEFKLFTIWGEGCWRDALLRRLGLSRLLRCIYRATIGLQCSLSRALSRCAYFRVTYTGALACRHGVKNTKQTTAMLWFTSPGFPRSEEHTSELQS